MSIEPCNRARTTGSRLERGVKGVPSNRRRFLADALRGAALLLTMPAAATAEPVFGRILPWAVHPEPRPGIDGSKVLTREQVSPRVADLFEQIRDIAPIADGIGCHCGCGFIEGMRSLLSCYEGVGMAQGCHICEGEGRLAVRLERQGASLDQIRAAIDRAYR